jgi:hypothetical protein
MTSRDTQRIGAEPEHAGQGSFGCLPERVANLVRRHLAANDRGSGRRGTVLCRDADGGTVEAPGEFRNDQAGGLRAAPVAVGTMLTAALRAQRKLSCGPSSSIWSPL